MKMGFAELHTHIRRNKKSERIYMNRFTSISNFLSHSLGEKVRKSNFRLTYSRMMMKIENPRVRVCVCFKFITQELTN